MYLLRFIVLSNIYLYLVEIVKLRVRVTMSPKVLSGTWLWFPSNDLKSNVETEIFIQTPVQPWGFSMMSPWAFSHCGPSLTMRVSNAHLLWFPRPATVLTTNDTRLSWRDLKSGIWHCVPFQWFTRQYLYQVDKTNFVLKTCYML